MHLNSHSPAWYHIDGAKLRLNLGSIDWTEKFSHYVLQFFLDQLIIITSYRSMT